MNNDNTINWFGKQPKQKKGKVKNKSKLNYNSVSYLGLSPKQAPQKINFFGIRKKNKQYRMTPSPLFRKESINQKHLSKYGDVDMDGSPNINDCDPINFLKDAEEDEQGNRPKIKEVGVVAELKKIYGGTSSKIKKQLLGPKRYSPLREARESINTAKKQRIQKEKEIKELLQYDLPDKERKKYEKDLEELKVKKNKTETKEKKIFTAIGSSKKIAEMLKGTGPAATRDIAIYNVQEKLAKGKKPNIKELKSLTKIQKRMRLVGDIEQEGKLSRDILTKVPGGEIGRVITGAGVLKSGEYSGALKAKAARVRRMTGFAAGQVFGPNLTRTNFDSEPRGRGRPSGPSGEYKIGGRPVYEEEFQQYSAKQNALNRMLPSGTQSQTLNPEYIAYMKAKAAAERGETQTVMTEDGMPMEGQVSESSQELPKMGTSMMQTGQQQIDMQNKRAYNRAAPDEIKQAQYQAQAMDNPLNAPNFMRGELKATGGSLLTPIGPSILEAPKVFQGEMRNVTQSNPDEGEVKLGERPQTNPYGDEFLDIELGSGKPVLRKRIRERWMTGEAL